MAVRLRLMRTGKRKHPSYRVVAADSRSPRDSRVLEILGTYYPLQEPSGIEINNDRVVHWMSKGAKPSEAVAKLLKICGATDEFEASKSNKASA